MPIPKRWSRFSDSNIAKVPNEPGGYELGDSERNIIYLGSSNNLRERLKQYKKEPSKGGSKYFRYELGGLLEANFMKSLEKDGYRSYFLFETLVLKLLSKHLEEQGKPFATHVRIDKIELDGLAPEGIDDLSGPTLVEIKLYRKPQIAFLRHVLDRVYSMAHQKQFQSILLIIGGKLTPKERQRVAQLTKDWMESLTLRIWDLNDLLALSQKYAEFVSDLVPALRELAIYNVVEKSLKTDPLEWKKTRKQNIEQLKKLYSKNNLVLFIGAGVPQTAGMPDWKSLLSKLLVAMIEKRLPETLNVSAEEKRVLANELQKFHGYSPQLEARYIRAGLGNSFGEAVSKSLYDGIGKDSCGTSNLLKFIARLCVPTRSGPGIKAVVTYNFDDLIEKHLEETGVRYRSIYRDVDVASQAELGIFHVHGFLPRDVKRYDGVSESLLVFSEEGYHTLFLDPYSWSNIVQLSFLRDSTCLLIGLSVTDPNLRRLLDIAARKNKDSKHYVLLKRQLSTEFLDNIGESTIKIQPEVIQTFLSVHHRLQETSFQELGLKIIWFENYDEIPEILDSIQRVI